MTERRDVEFEVEGGDRLRRWPFIPDGRAGPRPAISMAHGFAGIKEQGIEAPRRPATLVGTVEVTRPDRPLWPGITKLDLAQYSQTVADVALPGLVRRPLAVVRYPATLNGF